MKFVSQNGEQEANWTKDLWNERHTKGTSHEKIHTMGERSKIEDVLEDDLGEISAKTTTEVARVTQSLDNIREEQLTMKVAIGR